MAKGDLGRRTDEAQRHFVSLLMQQGRVALDEDWNDEDVDKEIRRICRLSVRLLTAASLRKLAQALVAGGDIGDVIRGAAVDSGQRVGKRDVRAVTALGLAFLQARFQDESAAGPDPFRVDTQKLCGVHRFLVVDNRDPRAACRLKIRAPAILGDMEPWAMPSIPAGSETEKGKRCVPEVGTTVWVVFEDGDPDRPVWIGTAPDL